MEQYLPIILTTASSVVVLLIGWGLKVLSAYVASKTDNENVQAAMRQFSEIVTTTVKDLSQTFKAAAADGKLTEEEKEAIKSKAIEKISRQVPESMEGYLNKALGDLESYVDSKIEATVRDIKR